MGALSQPRIQRLLTDGDAAATAYEKGRKFEEVIGYTFGNIPGVELYKSNVVNHAQSEEVDIAFFNNMDRRGLPFLEHFLLAECKNWSAPVGANNVREFSTKLKHRACGNGILVAANGITGDPIDQTAAHDAVRMALAVERIRILVVTRAEIETWTHTDDIIRLFKAKICELTVAGSIFI